MAKDVLPKLPSNAFFSLLGKLEKEICQRGAVRTWKGFPLYFSSNEDMNDYVEAGLSIDGASETVKDDDALIGKWDKSVFFPLLVLLIIKKNLRKWLTRAESGYNKMDQMIKYFSPTPSINQCFK